MRLPDYGRSPLKLIHERYSCRAFVPEPIGAERLEALRAFTSGLGPGPRGGAPRFELIAAESGDPGALKGLGTYGFIRDPGAFLAVAKGRDLDMGDLGFATELVVLKATELGLGSCWLGGTFNRSRFAAAAALRPGESLALAVALGDEAPGAREGTLRRRIAGGTRKAWAGLFIDLSSGSPIAGADALPALGIEDAWADALEALRLAPSASNKQPWLLARAAAGWELYLARSPGYHSPLSRLAGVADMQANDMGIAMSHFALAARERGLEGEWRFPGPSADRAETALAGAEYVATFS